MEAKQAADDQGRAERAAGEVLEAARRLDPEIRARAEELERERRLPADLARRFADAGFFRMAIPAAYGGAELDPAAIVRVIEAVSRSDGSSGWCVMIGTTTALLSGLLPEATGRAIYGSDPRVITGGTSAPFGRATEVPGGHRVSGRWPWGSGAQNCGWLVGAARVMDGDEPRRQAGGGPDMRFCFFPIADVRLHDDWDSSGLRGTGSGDWEASDVFVPSVHQLAVPLGAPGVDRPLYHTPFFGVLGAGVAAVAHGIARRALDEFVALAAVRVPTWESRPLAESPSVHATVGRAEAAVRSARAFLAEALDAMWAFARARRPTSLDAWRDLRLAAAHLVWQSAYAVDLVYHAAGGASVPLRHPLQRCFRDVHVVTQHARVGAGVYEQMGRYHLGVGTPPGQM